MSEVIEKEKFDQRKYNSAYTKEHYEAISFIAAKEKHLKERIKAQAEQEGMSLSQWIIRAIEKELEWYE